MREGRRGSLRYGLRRVDGARRTDEGATGASVPLPQETTRVLTAAKKLRCGDDVAVVFDGLRGKAMSNAGMSVVLKRM
jgi:hypothetical protein